MSFDELGLRETAFEGKGERMGGERGGGETKREEKARGEGGRGRGKRDKGGGERWGRGGRTEERTFTAAEA